MTPGAAAAIAALNMNVLDAVTSRLDLREPNRDAVHTVALRMEEFYATDRAEGEFFEGVVDAATGLGKTYVTAGLLDYYATLGLRNFAIIAPGQTIQRKTIAQFTRGHDKSLVDAMASPPFVIHSENFDNSLVASGLDDPDCVKLFIFTVQSLLKPKEKANRKTHTFREGLGKAFYEHLDELDDLVVFADEHHAYHGAKFSGAIRGLTPLALVGLTATPDEKQLKRDGIPVVFRYPLVAAIAERYVKTPVIVGRKDDRTDEKTQLLDAGALLNAKEQALAAYCDAHAKPPVHAVLLVTCRDIAHASETVAFLRSQQYFDGQFGGPRVVLEVHSNANKEEALAAFDGVDDPYSPTRIIVQVGMLKEGWDCKSVYVIASLRSSVSEVLTEQTLGRGLRLPFGEYTDEPLLDELDVVAHERYEQLLERSDALTETFIDFRTVLSQPSGSTYTPVGTAPTRSAHGTAGGGSTGLPGIITSGGAVGEVQVGTTIAEIADGASSGVQDAGARLSGGATIGVAGTEERIAAAKAAGEAAELTLFPRKDFTGVWIPVMVTTPQTMAFSTAMLTNEAAFREIGFKLAASPNPFLRRTQIDGEIQENLLGGSRVVKLRTRPSTTQVPATAGAGDVDEAKAAIVAEVVNGPLVAARAGERASVKRLLDAVLTGAGGQANMLLQNYPRAVSRALRDAIASERSKLTLTQLIHTVDTQAFLPGTRRSRSEHSADRHGRFVKGMAYTGFNKSAYAQDWFDSKPERDLANIADDASDVDFWVRLQRNDLPILWNGASQSYNPDFLVRSTTGENAIVEVKADSAVSNDDVQAKRQAAMTWANTATNDDETWRYLLAAEQDLRDCQGDWNRLVQLTRP